MTNFNSIGNNFAIWMNISAKQLYFSYFLFKKKKLDSLESKSKLLRVYKTTITQIQ